MDPQDINLSQILKGWKSPALPRGWQGKLEGETGAVDMDALPAGVNWATCSAGWTGQGIGDGGCQCSALLTPVACTAHRGWPSCADCSCNQACIPKSKEIKKEIKSAGEKQAAPTPASPMQSMGQQVKACWWAQYKAPARPHHGASHQEWLVGSCSVPLARLPGLEHPTADRDRDNHPSSGKGCKKEHLSPKIATALQRDRAAVRVS